ncbi:MAG: division/cell wall cluster transcriptional repressor MraZ [Chitinispirillales bacterium]|jgi:MraZ protein|nr:division/cell wall cluster transcriptional repressor MraZ [Chitinispirillales bacterium]
MASFYGSFDYSVDAKGRVNIPAKFRKALSPEAEDTFIVTYGSENCLEAYPKDVWNKRIADLADHLPRTPENDKWLRFISGTSADSVLDVQGRIILSATQMKYANITKNVTIVGNIKGYIELWDSERYKEYIGATMKDFDTSFYAVEDQLAKMGQSAQV